MKYISRIFLKGLAAVLPITLTLYFAYWLAISLERLLKQFILLGLPGEFYWPGLGLLIGIGLIFLAGLLIDAWVVRKLFNLGEYLLEKIPLLKSVYGSLRDFMDYFSRMKEDDELQKVVSVKLGETYLIGFLTGAENRNNMPAEIANKDMVSVYLPMSYQIGGFTLYVPREKVESIDMNVEDAMRLVLTAGLSNSDQTRK
ncbi:MAG: DUF502 domain-containing protein [Desulfocapsaceae bacterium]|nr:DUF502 domain-containing protein [Desulfocapsaceae bacterium]